MKIVIAESVKYNDSIFLDSQHYAKRFALEGHKVYWLVTPISFLHYTPIAPVNAKKAAKTWSPKLVQMSKNIFQIQQLSLLPFKGPLIRYPNLQKINLMFSIPTLRCCYKPDVLWVVSPAFLPLVRILSPKYSIFRKADDYEGFLGKGYSYLEKKIINDYDIIAPASIIQSKEIQKKYKNVFVKFLPNGAPYSSVAEDLSLEEKNNTIIYVGALNWWFDIELVIKCAKTYNKTEFVIAGPNYGINIEKLKEIPNIHYIGPVSYNKALELMKKAKVGIIPFKKTKMIESVHPIKMYEYLFSGLNVVSTSWAELEAINAPIFLSKNHDDFIAHLGRALNNKPNINEFNNFLARRSWDDLYFEIKNLLQKI